MENKDIVKKLKTVKVETPKGIKTVTMVPVLINLDEDEVSITSTFCGSCCPYGSICGKLCDPRDPDNKEKSLSDWCNEIGYTDETMETCTDFSTMHPMEGEIEKLYDEDSSSFKQLMEQNPLINLNTFIDNVCPGFCDKYNKEHSNCGLDNDFCICKGLFVRKLGTSYLNEKKESDDKS